MSLLIGGVISAIFGLISLIFFWSDFMTIIRGAFPIFLLLGGALAVYVGIDELQEKTGKKNNDTKKNWKKHREKLNQSGRRLNSIKRN